MSPAWFAALSLTLLTVASSAVLAQNGGVRDRDVSCREPSQVVPGFWGGVGSYRRRFEIDSDVAVDEHGLVAHRVNVAAAFAPIKNNTFHKIVLRTPLGFVTDTRAGAFRMRGPMPSVGLLFQTPCEGYRLEFGVRLVLPWTGGATPNDHRLSLDAILTSGTADDAFWLPIDGIGSQVYATMQIRSRRIMQTRTFPLFFGGSFGLVASPYPLSVASWLGSQKSFVGSFFVEGYVALVRAGSRHANVRLGGRGEVSLTSVWPGGEILPLVLEGFVGWSPKHWLSVHAFAGSAGFSQSAANESWRFRSGVRLAVYVP